MSDNGSIEIRSFRSVFDLERRIYRLDQLRLNPSGVPIRGIAYLVGLAACTLLLGTVPFVGALLALLPWYVHYAALPFCGSALLTSVRVEGRPFHLAGLALMRYVLSPRHLNGLKPCSSARECKRWYPPELLVLPDGSDSQLRRVRFVGPGAALVAVAHECTVLRAGGGRRAPRLMLRGLGGHGALTHGRVLELAKGVRLDIYSGG
jgi:hypothetical protein